MLLDQDICIHITSTVGLAIISKNSDCVFHFEDVKILETGRYDQEIRFMESILLKYDRQNLNTCERSISLEIV